MRNQKITFSLSEELIGRLKNLRPTKRNLLVKLALEKELDREACRRRQTQNDEGEDHLEKEASSGSTHAGRLRTLSIEKNLTF
jgi:hypothetical protein